MLTNRGKTSLEVPIHIVLPTQCHFSSFDVKKNADVTDYVGATGGMQDVDYEGMQTNTQGYVMSGTQNNRGFAEVQVKYLMSEFIEISVKLDNLTEKQLSFYFR